MTIYLDNAATTVHKPKQVIKAMTDCLNSCASSGRGGHKMGILASQKVFECRSRLCQLFGIKNIEDIAFTYNATYGMNMALKGLLEQNSHVIISGFEHNAVVRPLNNLGVNKGIKYTALKSMNLDNLKTAVTPKTKAIVCNHISNVFGYIAPINEIGNFAKQNGIKFILDAAQSAGTFKIDVIRDKIDILVFTGHKGLLGPQGTGGLYINPQLKLETLIEGGTGSMSELPLQPDFMPDRFESGTLNVAGLSGLSEGVKFVLDTGVDQIKEKERTLCQKLFEGFSNIKGVKCYNYPETGILSINLENMDCVEVATILDSEHNIAVRPGLHCSPLAHETRGTIKSGTIRFSVGYYNNVSDINKAINAVNKIIKNKKGGS